MKPAESYETFPEIKERLDWIVNQVSRDDIPLEEALSLYEEAVKLGARVSTLNEDAQGEDEKPQLQKVKMPLRQAALRNDLPWRMIDF